MSTHSIHGVQLNKQRVFVQDMYNDGMPLHNGAEFYHEPLKVISHGMAFPSFCTQELPHYRQFAEMVCHMLNWWQWRTPANYKHQFIVTPAKWAVYDYGQRWAYLWRPNGDYEIWENHHDRPTKLFVIPWTFTYLFAKHWTFGHETMLKPFWGILNKWPGHSEKEVRLPILEMEYGQVCAYPEHKDQGYRDYCILRLNGNDLSDSLFASEMRTHDFKSRNRRRLVIDGKEPLFGKVM